MTRRPCTPHICECCQSHPKPLFQIEDTRGSMSIPEPLPDAPPATRSLISWDRSSEIGQYAAPTQALILDRCIRPIRTIRQTTRSCRVEMRRWPCQTVVCGFLPCTFGDFCLICAGATCDAYEGHAFLHQSPALLNLSAPRRCYTSV